MLQALVPSLKDAHLGKHAFFFPAHCSDPEVEGLFDSYSLFEDMLAHPALYLNGTAPLNTTGCVHSCVYQLNESTADTGVCTIANGTDRDSFLWYVAIYNSLTLFFILSVPRVRYDELHPSEQTDRNIAKEVAEIMEGKPNRWTTWLS